MAKKLKMIFLIQKTRKTRVALPSSEEYPIFGKNGHVSDNNRPNKGLTFHCECCHFELHADLIGARNITLRTILSRQDWERTGVLSIRPDASNR